MEVSPEFISSVTDAVMDEVTAWQSRPLEVVYPVVFFDALRVKIREDAVVRNKAIYLALGVLPDGSRDILGLWIEGTEGAKFWMKVFNDLKTRGCNDILIAVTDGLKGMPEALAAVYPATTLQTCVVHLIRNSLDYVMWKDSKAAGRRVAPDLHGHQCRGRRSGAGCVRARHVGQEVPDRCRRLAPGLESCNSVLHVPAANSSGDLHHQRNREHQRTLEENHQDARALPQ